MFEKVNQKTKLKWYIFIVTTNILKLMFSQCLTMIIVIKKEMKNARKKYFIYNLL